MYDGAAALRLEHIAVPLEALKSSFYCKSSAYLRLRPTSGFERKRDSVTSHVLTFEAKARMQFATIGLQKLHILAKCAIYFYVHVLIPIFVQW